MNRLLKTKYMRIISLMIFVLMLFNVTFSQVAQAKGYGNNGYDIPSSITHNSGSSSSSSSSSSSGSSSSSSSSNDSDDFVGGSFQGGGHSSSEPEYTGNDNDYFDEEEDSHHHGGHSSHDDDDDDNHRRGSSGRKREKKSFGEAVGDFIKKMGSRVKNAIAHPVDTLKNVVGETVKGAKMVAKSTGKVITGQGSGADVFKAIAGSAAIMTGNGSMFSDVMSATPEDGFGSAPKSNIDNSFAFNNSGNTGDDDDQKDLCERNPDHPSCEDDPPPPDFCDENPNHKDCQKDPEPDCNPAIENCDDNPKTRTFVKVDKYFIEIPNKPVEPEAPAFNKEVALYDKQKTDQSIGSLKNNDNYKKSVNALNNYKEAYAQYEQDKKDYKEQTDQLKQFANTVQEYDSEAANTIRQLIKKQDEKSKEKEKQEKEEESSRFDFGVSETFTGGSITKEDVSDEENMVRDAFEGIVGHEQEVHEQ